MSDENTNKEDYSDEDIVSEFSSKKPSMARRVFFKLWMFLLISAFLVSGGALVYKTGFTYSQVWTNGEDISGLLPLSESTPQPDANRLNVLLLGLRGEDDPNGGLLTDSLILLSIDLKNKKAAMISIPRDLYIKMPGEEKKEKINFAHALGYQKKGSAGGLFFSKVAISKITGLYIDYAVSIDHEAFREIVDILGGIDITLERPFREDSQFSKEMIIDLPAGENHLNGTTTLYFVRSRFSTSDFDRAKRQQQVLVAVKEKAFSLGVLANPVKIFQILDSLGKNVRTDMPISKVAELVSLVSGFENRDIKHKVFDTTPEGFLYDSKTESGAYILLPVGDEFSKIQEYCRNIFK
ncbi:MAG: Cell envelope-related transcriptional attenuator [Parcubacteria group bacterium GW2011_GWC1_43_12]|nr:MAG: Cell envelope-related transcriptional attenuator [Parcubacteria group bacterium GW2011_GWB1_42_6]KKS91897.1 MAG: Cell envelope-related transcriptional attenuator [Parcubacteria group bacterium GW2011_GWC1_43_12]